LKARIFLAVESGGTKTIASIFSDEGELLGYSIGGPSSHHVVGITRSKDTLKAVISECVASAGLKDYVFEIGCFGMASLDTPKDFEIISEIVRSMNIVKNPIIVGDHITAYYTVTGGRPGIVVIAGTGSIGYGRIKDGVEARAGGWEWLVSDEGSAYDIARKALVYAVRSYDGLEEEKTSLLDKFMKHLKASSFEEFIQKLYEDPGKHRIASLAPIVASAAYEGDKVARKILRTAGKELGLLAFSVAKKLGVENDPIVVGCLGGVFRAGPIIFNSFKKFIRNKMPNAIIMKPAFSAIEGAIFLCLREAGIELSEDLMKKIRSQVRKLDSQRKSCN